MCIFVDEIDNYFDMVILVLIFVLLLAAFFCSRSGGDCYGKLKSKKDLAQKHEHRDNNFLL
ncbi:MAG: hypothetical protein P8Q14_09820 [Vicingaceae bacterium]|nr:hypothetical protein [Vicingaceae bacterium]